MTRWIQIVIGMILLLTIGTSVYADQKVLIVHSYHEGFDWVDQMNRGIVRAFPQTGYELKFHYMDTKRHSDETWKQNSGKQAIQVCQTFSPDIVIACDDNAQTYFANKLSRQPQGPQVVFCGVNADPKQYGYPNDKANGILERPHITNTLRLAKSLKPSIKKVTILGDQSTSSDQIMQYSKTLKMPVHIQDFATADTFQQWQAQVLQANIDSDALLVTLYQTIKASSIESRRLPPSEVMAWTVKHSRIPILGLYPFTVDDGAVLAISASPMEHGYLASRMAMDILRTNMKASRFKMNTGVEGLIMFNIPSAQRFDIHIPTHLLKMSRHIVQRSNNQQAAHIKPNMN